VRYRWLISGIALLGSAALAQEPVVTLESTVSGSREQPRVMYIVPWQEPEAASLDYDLDNQLVQEVFAPIDRDEFMREVQLKGRIASDLADKNSIGQSAEKYSRQE